MFVWERVAFLRWHVFYVKLVLNIKIVLDNSIFIRTFAVGEPGEEAEYSERLCEYENVNVMLKGDKNLENLKKCITFAMSNKTNKVMSNKVKHSSLYYAAKSAKVGSVIKCACCGREFVKRHYQEKFCCPKCKDDYWNKRGDRHKDSYYRDYNYSHPERLQRVGYLRDEDSVPYDDVMADMRDEDCPECDW